MKKRLLRAFNKQNTSHFKPTYIHSIHDQENSTNFLTDKHNEDANVTYAK